MWDLSRPGLEPMSPALAGGFLTTAPPGKPPLPIFKSDSLLTPFVLEQQSCQPVGPPFVRGHSWSSRGFHPRVLILRKMCLMAAGRTRPYLQHSCSTNHLFINNLGGYFPCASDCAGVNFLSPLLDHMLHPLCLVQCRRSGNVELERE